MGAVRDSPLFKIMLMRVIFTILLLAVSFTAISQAPDHSGATDSSYRFKTVCLPVKSVTEVLYVIDGIVSDESVLRRLNPSLIDSIFILKDSATRIFSCRPSRPVILIYTRRSNNHRITIRDKEGQFPLPGATVTFISSDRRDTLMYVADSAGQVSRNDLKREKTYSVSVTAVGYKSFAGTAKGIKSREIELERDFILGPEVIVSSGHVCIYRRLYVYQEQQVSQECGMQVKLIIEQTTEKTSKLLAKRELSVYPNPVQRGQSVSLKLLQGFFPAGTIRVISLDGKLVATIPVNGDRKQGMVNLPTQQSWASGLYIFQLVYANGRVGASEKVILQ